MATAVQTVVVGLGTLIPDFFTRQQMGGDKPIILSVSGWEIESSLDKQQSVRHWQIILGASSNADNRILGDGLAPVHLVYHQTSKD